MKIKCLCAALLFVSLATGSAVYQQTSAPSAPEAGEYVSAEVADPYTAPQGSPSANENDPAILLVNRWNPLPEGYAPSLVDVERGHSVDVRAADALISMLGDMRAAGLSPLIVSSYRTHEKQQTLFENRIRRFVAQGYSRQRAEAEAARWVAIPGTSEHQTGLAVDIVSVRYQNLDYRQENTPEQKWLMANSWRYGFILRYPADKSSITGIAYEPWHYRYVGQEAAGVIYAGSISFEEYLLGTY